MGLFSTRKKDKSVTSIEMIQEYTMNREINQQKHKVQPVNKLMRNIKEGKRSMQKKP